LVGDALVVGDVSLDVRAGRRATANWCTTCRRRGPLETLMEDERSEAIENPDDDEAQMRHRHAGERSDVD